MVVLENIEVDLVDGVVVVLLLLVDGDADVFITFSLS
jgi:hypothetical protein